MLGCIEKDVELIVEVVNELLKSLINWYGVYLYNSVWIMVFLFIVIELLLVFGNILLLFLENIKEF